MAIMTAVKQQPLAGRALVFKLIELIVVIGAIPILASLLLPLLSLKG
jgi:hypothetical protein